MTRLTLKMTSVSRRSPLSQIEKRRLAGDMNARSYVTDRQRLATGSAILW
jgi:hypothetical protein